MLDGEADVDVVFLHFAWSRDMAETGWMYNECWTEEDLSPTIVSWLIWESCYCLFCYGREERRDERARQLAGQPCSENSLCG